MRLDRDFFNADPVTVARALVGAGLEVTGADGRRCAGRLVEVEAYGGHDDPASHAAGGPTPRSAIMFGPAGLAYVYFVYGMHHCLNITTGPPGTAGAVLIRALEPVAGRDVMAMRRGLDPTVCRDRELGGGPGRLCQALGIDLGWNGVPVAAGLLRPNDAPGRLRLSPASAPPPIVTALPRIGIRRAVDRPWRFCDALSVCLSRPVR